MSDAERTLTESSKFMWVQLESAGWFRLLSASVIWRWWLKDADLYKLKLELKRSIAIRSFPREN